MRDMIRGLALIMLVAIVAAIVIPFGLWGARLAETWTRDNTGQLLGGGLAICGGALMLVAVFVGAGAFARLAGWRPPRREEAEQPANMTPHYAELPPPAPRWGMTGGGQYELLPPPAEQEDRRYSLVIRKPKDQERGG